MASIGAEAIGLAGAVAMFKVQGLRNACVAAAVVSLVSVGAANAATLLSLGGTSSGSHNLDASFNPIVTPGIAGLMALDGVGIGTNLTLYSGGGNDGGLFATTNPADLKFTYIGHDASFTDTVTLTYNNNLIFNNQSTPSGTETLASLVPIAGPPGAVPFKFTISGSKNAINGGAIDDGLNIGVYLVSNVVAYVFLDDGGGSPGIDGDFDDVVFRVAVTCGPNGQECSPDTTPIPAALPLFVSGLGGLGYFSWRRKRKAAAAAAV